MVTRDEGLLDENAVADVEDLFGEMKHIGNLEYTIDDSEYEASSSSSVRDHTVPSQDDDSHGCARRCLASRVQW